MGMIVVPNARVGQIGLAARNELDVRSKLTSLYKLDACITSRVDLAFLSARGGSNLNGPGHGEDAGLYLSYKSR